MKNTILLLTVTLAIVLGGCSDPSLPVSPTDQPAEGVASLQKDISRSFTTTEGPDLLNPAGFIIDAGFSPPHNKNKLIVRGMVLRNLVSVTFLDGGLDILSGHGVLEMNFTFDNSASEGVCWGKLTLDPDAPEAGDGVWEITWNGTITLGASGFVCPLKWVGHGKGGTINGMQFFSDDQVMTIWSMPDGWTGAGTGIIKSH